jgi:hypothetical protein
VSHVLSAKKQVDTSSKAGIHTDAGGTDIDSVASLSE